MASDDFLLLTDLIYNKGWSIEKVTHNFGNEIGWKSTVVVGKNGQTQELQSSAEDFVSFAVQHQKIVDARGKGRLLKIRNSEKYWNDIERLVDIDGGKTRAAIESIVAGKFKFTFNPVKGIREILQDRISTSDPDVRGVKTHFFETFAAVLIESQQFLKLKEAPQKSNASFAGYASTYETILRHGFFGEADKTNIIDAYKKYTRSVRIDHGDLLRRIDEQKKYTEFLRQLLVKAGSVEPQNGARAVVDAYWRLCELCYPMLYVAQAASTIAEGKLLDPKQPTFQGLVESLSNNPATKNLVECVEPILRNSEAHCASSVVMENGLPVVVAYDSRRYPVSEIKRFPLSEIISKLNCLISLVAALFMTLELFEHAFLLLVLNSYEFKMRLVTLDQY